MHGIVSELVYNMRMYVFKKLPFFYVLKNMKDMQFVNNTYNMGNELFRTNNAKKYEYGKMNYTSHAGKNFL